MRYLILPLLTILLATMACTKEEQVSEVEKEKPNQIVLIFNKPVKNGFYTFPGTEGGQGRTNEGDEVQFIDNHYMQQRLSFKIGASSDTLVIKSNRDIVEVLLMYKGLDDLNYLFENGDSVVFDYEGIKPTARVLNRLEDPSVTNFSLYVRDSILLDDYPALNIAQQPMYTWRKHESSNLPFLALNEKIKKDALAHARTELTQQYDRLDKLKKEGKLSTLQHRARAQNILRNIQISQLRLSQPRKGMEQLSTPTIDKALKDFKDRFPEMDMARNDSFLYHHNYLKYLGLSVYQIYLQDIAMLSQQTRGGGGSTLDKLRQYDTIRANAYLSPLEKKVMQYEAMNSILSQPTFFSIADRLKYLTRFRNDFQDTVMVESLITRFNIEFKIEDEIMLEDTSGKEFFFDKVIAQHKGNVIYVDFWASWCTPCIKEMPHSKKLQTELKDQDIVYLYLSSDRTASPWKRAMTKHELNTGQHYRLANASTSKGLEDMQILFIPRYMIYDTTGKLVNEDAPRPSEIDLLKTEFARYL